MSDTPHEQLSKQIQRDVDRSIVEQMAAHGVPVDRIAAEAHRFELLIAPATFCVDYDEFGIPKTIHGRRDVAVRERE